jgi:hypothetical protein
VRNLTNPAESEITIFSVREDFSLRSVTVEMTTLFIQTCRWTALLPNNCRRLWCYIVSAIEKSNVVCPLAKSTDKTILETWKRQRIAGGLDISKKVATMEASFFR